MSGLTLAWLAFACTLAFLALWFFLILRVAIARGRRVLLALVIASLVLAVLSLVLGAAEPGRLLAGISLAVGCLYLFRGARAAQSTQAPAVAVGAPLPGFTAPDENGEPFALESLRGHPVLLKFFRGHW